MQENNCVAFKGLACVTGETTDLNVQIGKNYFYDPIENRLTLECKNKGCCGKCCCKKCCNLNPCGKVYAVGMPDNKVCII